MDTAGGFEGGRSEVDEATDAAVDDRVFDLGGDERRMHVRAYNHWVSLLDGGAFPGIDRLDPEQNRDFGPHGVLLDFGNGIDDPSISYLGATLRAECGLDATISRVADVPSRSLLSRLTDHYLQIIANRAPIGFEAEFVGTSGASTLYRGILMPFSSNGETIDFIYGVINWKVMADADTQATLTAELDAAVRAAPTAHEATTWADGPSAEAEASVVDDDADRPVTAPSLDSRLASARDSAAQVRACDARGRAALYRALGRAHDFACAAAMDPDAYVALLDRSAIAPQPRAPMTPIVKLVFGSDYEKTRLAEYAAVLAHARREGVAEGALAAFVDGFAGGIKAIVAAERAARRPASRPDVYARAAAELRAMPVLATVPLAGDAAEFVVLVARAGQAGMLDIVTRIDTPAVVAEVVRRAAA